MLEMNELVHHNIINKAHWRHDDAPVEADLTLAVAAAPALLLVTDQQAFWCYTELCAVEANPLRKTPLSLLLIPADKSRTNHLGLTPGNFEKATSEAGLIQTISRPQAILAAQIKKRFPANKAFGRLEPA